MEVGTDLKTSRCWSFGHISINRNLVKLFALDWIRGNLSLETKVNKLTNWVNNAGIREMPDIEVQKVSTATTVEYWAERA